MQKMITRLTDNRKIPKKRLKTRKKKKLKMISNCEKMLRIQRRFIGRLSDYPSKT